MSGPSLVPTRQRRTKVATVEHPKKRMLDPKKFSVDKVRCLQHLFSCAQRHAGPTMKRSIPINLEQRAAVSPRKPVPVKNL